ncbi:putative lipid II flippase FtsW [Arthrobacter sp. VKM Ac-2550]|uniref:putative lipid II flippase FtsW n=1 Tax=Crystallibacter permensis TaxID=1938888 RepID=UPI002225DE61|nr:putative lipid II flippase FtsW [Arthrobacter sp. VKM Ac-2550]MCW2133265.1 cell division-specific peptidoglycan biosynthesis regulator FtsW [Arthrobacter sp. VKM Ac-2550]
MVNTPNRETSRKPASKASARPAGAAAGKLRNPEEDPEGSKTGLRVKTKALLDRIEGTGQEPTGFSYYLILGSAFALTAIGLLMVLSSSAVESIADGESPFELFVKQGIFAVIGLVLMLLLSRLNVPTFKKLGWPALALALALLVLVFTPLGIDVNGNRNWIQLGPGVTAQPSEAAKLALGLWMACVLVRKGPLLGEWKHAVVPVLPVGGLVILLVLLGNDLGTAMIIMLIIAGALYFAGARMKLFLVAGGAAVVGVLLLAITSPNRVARITMWLDQSCEVTTGLNMQSCNGLFALASGGWWGVGLGQSRQKYSWIPEAHNDYIFAIIGEELGLLGTLVVVALFGILSVAIVRTVMRHDDPFVRIFGGSIMVWIIGQAFLNMGVVTGLLPVVGVPLPFISYGGSALTITLAAVGVLLSFARPDARAGRNRARKRARNLAQRKAPEPAGNISK